MNSTLKDVQDKAKFLIPTLKMENRQKKQGLNLSYVFSFWPARTRN